MPSKGFLEALSDETIVEIFVQLTPRERARFSSINKRLYRLLHSWSDINRITAHKEGVVLASDRCILEVQGIERVKEGERPVIHMLASALRCSPFIQKLVISSVNHIRSVPATAFSHLSNVRELTLPCDIFEKELKLNDKIEAIFSIKKLLVLRILKRFDTPRKALNVMREEHVQKLQANALRMLKLQGVSLTPLAMEAIAKKYSDSLKYLCLMGVLVHTPDASIYLQALCNLKCLSKLTLPPSLLSLSSKPLYREYRMLRQLTAKCISVFVYESEIVETRFFIKKLLPDILKELCLHDPTHLVARDLKNDEFRKLHFKVKFCQRSDSLYQQEWMHGHCELLSHMVWVPPYKHFNTDFPHPVPGWWFFMSENVETAVENSEITATDTPPTPPRQPASQLHLPPNEDPGEMMMATIARFFERMIDDQLNAEFGAGALSNVGGLVNVNNNVATPNTASQLPGSTNRNENLPQSATSRPRPSLVLISTGGRGGLTRLRGRPTSQITRTQTAPPTQTPPQETSRTGESPDSEDSENSEHDGSSNSPVRSRSTTSTTTTATATTTSGSARRIPRLTESHHRQT